MFLESKHNLGLNQYKLMIYLANLYITSNNKQQFYSFQVKNIAIETGIDNTKDFYSRIKLLIHSLTRKELVLIDNDGSEMILNWLSSVKFYNKMNTFEIEFSERIKPYLKQIHDFFSGTILYNLTKFKSSHALRFYEIIMERNKGSKIELTIEQLKDIRNLTDKYDKFNDFKKRVIERGVIEINQLSDIDVEYEVIKLNKKPYRIILKVFRKKEIENNEKFTKNTNGIFNSFHFIVNI